MRTNTTLAPTTTTSKPHDVYQWLDDVEQLGGYVPGGYHPTHLGDEFSQGRYRVIHKLGFGSYSTGTFIRVWLVRDQRENRYVALKNIVAHASATSLEGKILRHLRQGNPKHPGRSCVQILWDEFFVDGPNGRHLCLMTEVAGCSVAESKEASTKWMFPINIARAIAAQTTMGLAYIHSCGVIHGDLHPNNILFQIPNLDSLTVDQVYAKYGEPIKVPNRRIDNDALGPEVPSYSIFPIDMIVPADHIKSHNIQISDFGAASLIENPPTTLNIPVLLRPPEAFFDEKLGPQVDIWTLGCILYEILGEHPLFEAFIPNMDDTLAEMVSTLGKLPSRWWGNHGWPKRPVYFMDDGSWNPDFRGIMSPVTKSLKERIQGMGRDLISKQWDFALEEIASLERLLAAMLRYEPEERVTADDAMRSEYMTKWGCPAIHII